MIALKVEQRDGKMVLVPNEETLALLGPKPGDVFVISHDAQGNPTLIRQPSQDERFERGKAFLERYRTTFDALAK